MVDVCHDGDVSKIRARIHVRIIPVQSTNHENERRPSLEAQQAVGPQTEDKVLPQQAAM
jgi:hypothetical protein